MLGNATIRNLRFDSSCVFDGAWSSALTVKTDSKSSVVIENVHSSATVRSGGIAGGLIVYVNSLDGIFDSCSNNGDITVTTQHGIMSEGVGGIVGYLKSQNTVIRECHNNGTIHIKMETPVRAIYVFHASGIVGAAYLSLNPLLTVESCTNSGNVTITVGDVTKSLLKNESVSGIISLYGMSSSDVTIHKCHNNGTISVSSQEDGMSLYGSGIASIITGTTLKDIVVNVTECSNHGIINTSGTTTAFSSGIVSSNFMQNLSLVSCMNRGFVTGTNHSCGLASYASNVENSVNTGCVNGSYSYGLVTKGSLAWFSVSIGDLQSSVCSYSTTGMFNSYQAVFFRDDIPADVKIGTSMVLNNNRWVDSYDNIDVMDYLNDYVGKQNFTMWWASNLTLGHQIHFNGTNIPESLKTKIVAEHDETIRSAIKREGPQELLNQKMFTVDVGLDFHVISDMSVAVKKVHTLTFVGVVNQTVFVLDGEVPTMETLKPISDFVNNKGFIITLTNNTTVLFNPNAPVTNSASYTIKKAACVKVVIGDGSGLTDDEIIEAITDGITDNDPATIIRVVDIIRCDDGSVVVRVDVEEDKADSAVVSITESDNRILRRVRRAFIVVDLSTSISSFSFLSLFVFFLSLSFFF